MQKCRKTERQKDRKTERQKDRKQKQNAKMQSAFKSEKVLPVINYAVDIECKSVNVLVKFKSSIFSSTFKKTSIFSSTFKKNVTIWLYVQTL